MPDDALRRTWFGESVRARRLLLHLSQGQLGARAGLDRKTVNRVEQAVQNLSMDRMWRLADALDIDVRDLLRPGAEPTDPASAPQ